MALPGRAILTGLGIIWACALAFADDADAVPSGARLIGDAVLVVDADGTNCVVIAGSDGLAVVDTGPGPHAAARVREAAEAVFGRTDVAFVVSTHCHWDHADGNQVFAGTPIIAHAACPDAMQRSFTDRTRLAAEPRPSSTPPPPPPPGTTLPPPEDGRRARAVPGEDERMDASMRARFAEVRLALPQLTFSDRMTVDLGDRTLQLISYGSGHSTSDILVVVPEERLLISGDLFFHRQLPLVTGDGVPDPARWIAALDELHELGAIRAVIPGHGEKVTPAELSFFERYVRWLVAGVDPGRRGEATTESLLSGALGFEHLPGPAPDLDPEVAARIHRANVAALVARSEPGSG